MLHTLLITHRILSISTYNQIYKGLDTLCKNKKENLYPIDNGYTTNVLKNIGFTRITITKKKIDPKYRHPHLQIEVQLNPTKLLEKDIIELTKEEDIELVAKKFDEEMQVIHMDLPPFYYWILNRIDYAVNKNTEYVDEYIKLFQRANKPYPFKEQYDKVSKERKQVPGSFYLISKSVRINFYDKEDERISQGSFVETSKNILRLEVQCNKFKTNSIKAKYELSMKYLGYFLSKEMSNEVINFYYDETIGMGDYYKLKEATKIIKSSKFSNNMQQKLIETLKQINKSRSIWKARKVSCYSKDSFNRYMRLLRELNINPVTIPEKWTVNYLPNVMTIKQ